MNCPSEEMQDMVRLSAQRERMLERMRELQEQGRAAMLTRSPSHGNSRAHLRRISVEGMPHADIAENECMATQLQSIAMGARAQSQAHHQNEETFWNADDRFEDDDVTWQVRHDRQLHPEHHDSMMDGSMDIGFDDQGYLRE